jgi:hypothetical protein
MFALDEGLLTAVILTEEAKLTLQVVGIQGFQKALADGLAATAHLVPWTAQPRHSCTPCGAPDGPHRCRAALCELAAPAGRDELPQHPLRHPGPRSRHRDSARSGLSHAARGCPSWRRPGVDHGVAVLGSPPPPRREACRHRRRLVGRCREGTAGARRDDLAATDRADRDRFAAHVRSRCADNRFQIGPAEADKV